EQGLGDNKRDKQGGCTPLVGGAEDSHLNISGRAFDEDCTRIPGGWSHQSTAQPCGQRELPQYWPLTPYASNPHGYARITTNAGKHNLIRAASQGCASRQRGHCSKASPRPDTKHPK